MIRLEMKKLQYDINRETAKKSVLSAGKIENHESLTGQEILTTDQSTMIEQTKFIYTSLGKYLEKQTKAIEFQSERQIKAIGKHGKQLVEANAFI